MKNKTIVFLILSLIAFASKAQLFPNIQGWTLNKEIRTYNADNLWGRINGAADAYLKFDFNELKVAEYRKDSSTYITVEVYQHKDADNAFGIYTQERPLTIELISIGAEGYKSKGILNFLSDNCYVKIYSPNQSNEIAIAMQLIATQLSVNITAAPSFPALLKCLPANNKIDRSERFIGKNFQGYDYFTSVFKTDYIVSGKQITVFITHKNSPSDCEQLLNQYFKSSSYSKKTKEGIFSFNNKYNGPVALEWKENYVWGVLNCNDEKITTNFLIQVKTLLIENKLITP